MGGLVFLLMPPPLTSMFSAPAKTISVVLSTASPQVEKPIAVLPKPIEKPKPVVKKKILTQKKSTYSAPQKQPKPVKKERVKPPVKPIIKPVVKPAPITKPKAAIIPSSPAPSAVVQQATFAPQPSYKPKPRYPATARRRGIEGMVVFEIFLSNNGSVNKAIITQSSGSGALDKSALKTVKTWRFPANRFNSLTSFKQSIEFKLYN